VISEYFSITRTWQILTTSFHLMRERERENINNINRVELSVFVGELEIMFVEVRYVVISPAVWL